MSLRVIANSNKQFLHYLYFRNGQPYIIAMTANAMAEDKESCLQVGMDDFISKTLNLQTVYQALESALSRIQ